MSNKERKSEKILGAMDGVGEDLIADAVSPRKKGVSKKLIFSLIAAVLAVTMIATPIALIAAHRARNTVQPPKGDPIVFNGSAYESDAAGDLPESLKTVTVTVDGANSRFISPSSTFTVKTAGDCDTETLSKYLSVYPMTEFSVKQTAGDTFEIEPATGSLIPGTVYQVRLGDPENPASSYAFQTEQQIVVKSMLPANESTTAPVDTGIEVSFSESVNADGFGKFFEISPKVDGEFYVYPDGRTVAFVPKKALEYNTVYTVTVKAGVTGVSGKKTESDTVSVFRTEKQQSEDYDDAGPYYSFYFNRSQNLATVFGTDDTASLELSFSSWQDAGFTNATVTLYRFPSLKAAYEAVLDAERRLGDVLSGEKAYDLSKLEKVSERTVRFTESNYRYSSQPVDFGSRLEKGVYLATASIGVKSAKGKTYTGSCYTFFQVSDLRKFTISSDGKTLLWVNGKNGVIAGANVEGVSYLRKYGWNIGDIPEEQRVETKISGKTGSDGIFAFDNGAGDSLLLAVTAGDDGLLIGDSTAATETGKYVMKYLYTDRETYFSSDTVNLYGFIVPMYGEKIEEELYLQTGASSIKQKLHIEKDGSFTASYKIEDMRASFLYMKIVDADGQVYASKSIRVTEESKPTITASMSFDKLAYRYGETMTVTVSASFFDGTPAPGYRFTVSTNYFDFPSTEVETDKDGKATVEIPTGYVEAYSTYPVTVTVYAELTGMETQTIYINDSVPYYHSDYSFDVLWENNKRTVRLQSYDLTNYPETDIGGDASGLIHWTLYKYVITKTEKTRYDSYSKRNVTYYEYKTTTSVEKSESVNITGKYDLPVYEVKGFTGGYYYEITFNDGRKTFKLSISATKYRNYYSGSDTPSFTLNVDKSLFKVGDGITADMTYGGETLKNVLFVLASNGIADHKVTDAYKNTFTKDLLPGATLFGVFYDKDQRYYRYMSAALNYDYAAAAGVKIEILPDKEVYKPGDVATVKVKAVGASGGAALISVVDEACFALGDQNAQSARDFWNSLNRVGAMAYRSYYYDYYDYYDYYYSYGRSNSRKQVTVNTSFYLIISVQVENTGSADQVEEELEPVAEAPEDGDRSYNADKAISNSGKVDTESYYLRKYFADNPEFKVVALNEDGEGTLVFTVPDNLTTWRVTACALSALGGELADMKIGSGMSDIVCTQSFFVQPSITSTYIVGDNASMSLRCYGKDLGNKVSYFVELYEDGKKILEQSAENTPGAYTWIHFGQLDAGTYAYRVYAECDGAKDAVEGKFSVTTSAAMVDVRKVLKPSEIGSITPLLYPVTLTFFDTETESSVLQNSLLGRLSYCGGSRFDAIIARYVAGVASSKYFGTDDTQDLKALKEKLSGYFNNYFSLLTYSEADPELTARALSLNASLVSSLLTDSQRERLISNYTQTVSQKDQDSETRLCAALLGLSALGEPVLDRLYGVSNEAAGYPLEAKLYLAAAFASIGDYGAAKELLTMLIESDGAGSKDYGTLYMKAETVSESIRLTELALLTASRVSRTDAEKMVRYLNESGSEDERALIGLACYLSFYMPTEKPEDKTVVYKIGDEERTLTVGGYKCSSVVLYKADLAAFSIVEAPKTVAIRAAYKGSLDDANADVKLSDRLTVEKSYRSNGNGTYTVSLKISGSSTRIHEYFELSDVIPTGARFVMYASGSNSWYDGNISTYGWIWNASGQNMTGGISVYNRYEAEKKRDQRSFSMDCSEYDFSVTVEYVIRGAVEGDFVSESALLRDANGAYALSKRSRIGIRENGEWELNI